MKADWKRRGGSNAGLFLFELMIAILFFALASAVCMQLFARAHVIARESSDLTMAVNKAQTAAECFKAADGSFERLAELLDAPDVQGGTLELQYDSSWNTTEEGGAYRMLIVREDGSPAVAQIEVVDLRKGAEKMLYSLRAAKYTEG